MLRREFFRAVMGFAVAAPCAAAIVEGSGPLCHVRDVEGGLLVPEALSAEWKAGGFLNPTDATFFREVNRPLGLPGEDDQKWIAHSFAAPSDTLPSASIRKFLDDPEIQKCRLRSHAPASDVTD